MGSDFPTGLGLTRIPRIYEIILGVGIPRSCGSQFPRGSTILLRDRVFADSQNGEKKTQIKCPEATHKEPPRQVPDAYG